MSDWIWSWDTGGRAGESVYQPYVAAIAAKLEAAFQAAGAKAKVSITINGRNYGHSSYRRCASPRTRLWRMTVCVQHREATVDASNRLAVP